MSPRPRVRCATRHLVAGVVCATLIAGTAAAQAPVRVASPDGRTQVSVQIRDGRAYYAVQRDGRALILPSLLGFAFQGPPPLRDSLRIADTSRDSHDEWWTQPWGEVARVHDHHNELGRSEWRTRKLRWRRPRRAPRC